MTKEEWKIKEKNRRVIHHIDFNPQRNCLSNLVPMTNSDHTKLHMAVRAAGII
jgi:hypothetical protein